MGVYGCTIPEEIGSLRSARHDFVHLAKSLGSVYVHWGRADIEQFKDLLNNGIIENMNCCDDAGKSAGKYCFRKEATGNMRGVDTGYIKADQMLEGSQAFGYSTENTFSGYQHQAEAPLDQRPSGETSVLRSPSRLTWNMTMTKKATHSRGLGVERLIQTGTIIQG